jgi:MarR family transcriptional regulator, organic hydroperoxide resistance regulator
MEQTDLQAAAQPIGYWSGAAHQAVIGYIRDTLAARGLSQPHGWVLGMLIVSDQGLTREEVPAGLRPNVVAPPLGPVVDDLLGRGWISEGEAGRLRITDAGRTGLSQFRELVAGIREQIHDGVSEEDYAVVVKVLRRMIGNVGGNTSTEWGGSKH